MTLEQSLKQLAERSGWIEQLEKALKAQSGQKSGPRAAAAR